MAGERADTRAAGRGGARMTKGRLCGRRSGCTTNYARAERAGEMAGDCAKGAWAGCAMAGDRAGYQYYDDQSMRIMVEYIQSYAHALYMLSKHVDARTTAKLLSGCYTITYAHICITLERACATLTYVFPYHPSYLWLVAVCPEPEQNHLHPSHPRG